MNQWLRVTLAATPVSGKTFTGWTCSAHCDSNSFTTALPIDVVLDNDGCPEQILIRLEKGCNEVLKKDADRFLMPYNNSCRRINPKSERI